MTRPPSLPRLIFAFGLAAALPLFAQKPAKPDAESAYQGAVKAYEQNRWQAALDSVDRARKKFPKSERESSLTLIAAKCALELRRLDRAQTEARKIVLEFPRSEYLDDAHWILAECGLLAENWETARLHLDWLLAQSPDSALIEAAAAARRELDAYLADLAAPSPPDSFAPEPVIGLVLPLSGPETDAAKAFLRGFTLRWRGSPPLVYDSQGDPLRAVSLADRLIAEARVWAVVGGLSPGETAALALTCQRRSRTFLTTACGSSGLDNLGDCVFQGRADFYHIGRELARFALWERENSTFAALTPLNDEGRQILAGFKQTLELAGCELLVEETYYPGAVDWTAQLKRIRTLGLKRAYQDSLRAFWRTNRYLLVDNSPYQVPPRFIIPEPPPPGVELDEGEQAPLTLAPSLLDSLWEADLARARQRIAWSRREVDSTEIPLSAIHGFLMVVEPGAVPTAAAQIARANLGAQILGNEHWGDRTALRQVQKYVDGIVFAEPLTRTEDSDYAAFADAVAKVDGGEVTPHHLAGARAADLLQSACARSHAPAELCRALAQIRDLPTLTGVVGFLLEAHRDRNVNLIRFADGRFAPAR